MNDYFWLIMLFPLAWPFVAKMVFGTSINWQETGLAIVMAAGLTTFVWNMGLSSKSDATEIINGAVTAKYRDEVSCSHSYDCNCWRDKDGHEHCSTCYRHSEDYDWIVVGTVGKLEIDRVDSQGEDMPPRFAAVRVGEPMAKEHHYDNWVRAADRSLFAANPALAASYEGKLPAYPGNVYDLYRIDRLVADGIVIMDAAQWNADISQALIDLGPRKQANLIVVITRDASPDYADALRAHWQGANKNDVVAVIGAPAFPAIAWARAFSWTKDELVNIGIRDRLQELGVIDRQKVMAIVTDEISTHFVRRSFKEFEYLKDEIEPPLWAVILAALIAIPGSLYLSWYFNGHDIDFLASRGFARSGPPRFSTRVQLSTGFKFPPRKP